MHALIRAVLVMSDEIARRAGLTHNIAPQERPNRRIVVPASKRLRQLQRAVTFRQSDLADLLASHGVPPATLDELTTPMGQLSIDDYQLDQGTLLARPIVRLGSHLIVALPGQLLVALRHAIVLRARAHGLVDELAARYHAAVISTVHDSLLLLDHHPVPLKPEHIPDVPLLVGHAAYGW